MTVGPFDPSDEVRRPQPSPVAVDEREGMDPGNGRRAHVLVAYDGSPPSVAAIEIGATLLPSARATVLHLWTPPFASEPLRRRLRERAKTAEQLVDLLEREGAAEAQRLVGTGGILAEAAGWPSNLVVKRTFGGDGIRFAAIAEEQRPDMALIGSRGLAGIEAALESFTELVLHHSAVPVLVVPFPLLSNDRALVANGRVVVGWDGSSGAERALCHAAAGFPGRELMALTVGTPEPGSDGDVETVESVAGRLGRDVQRVIAPMTGHRSVRPAIGAAHELVAAARRQGAGVIVVGSRGRSTWRETFLGSTALEVVHQANLPVLVVPATAEPDDEPTRPSHEQTTDTSPRESAAHVPHER